MKNSLQKLAAATALGLGCVVCLPESASAGGGVDISGWCQTYYGSPYFHGVVVSNNVYGWRCQYGTDAAARFNVDMNAACARQYGNPGTARFTDYNNPYSWYCV
ncbi:hypothetical protein [Amycolatopsis sp. Hca4]|uniref:hypothetical protein n=1 Tax=Amycolatopsis sp. Hca4 TaxID=2742131 RepID=UPI001592560E|nr:hypothetical protein [Amycolatopsis sp. Hca4]QKV73984.1 hypothetical protein HUT10_09540 [Amycolatopsis sp. Hca4]